MTDKDSNIKRLKGEHSDWRNLVWPVICVGLTIALIVVLLQSPGQSQKYVRAGAVAAVPDSTLLARLDSLIARSGDVDTGALLAVLIAIMDSVVQNQQIMLHEMAQLKSAGSRDAVASSKSARAQGSKQAKPSNEIDFTQYFKSTASTRSQTSARPSRKAEEGYHFVQAIALENQTVYLGSIVTFQVTDAVRFEDGSAVRQGCALSGEVTQMSGSRVFIEFNDICGIAIEGRVYSLNRSPGIQADIKRGSSGGRLANKAKDVLQAFDQSDIAGALMQSDYDKRELYADLYEDLMILARIRKPTLR